MRQVLSRRGGALARVLLALAILVAVGAGTAYLILTRTPAGGDSVDWAARRVVAMIEGTIVPSVEFGRFEYQSPRTLRFLDLALVAPEGERVVEAATLAVTLTEIPRINQPVRIERVALERGMVRLIETRDPESGDVGFRGLAPFLEESWRGAPEERPAQDYEGPPRLSDALRIREVDLVDCGLIYEPASGEPPMRLAGVTTTLEVEEAVEENGFVWHAFDLELARGSAMAASIEGRVDLDRVVVDLAPSTFRIDLTDAPAQELPPAIQTVLREHEARGLLEIRGSGLAPVRDLPAAKANASVRLTGFNVAFGEYKLPIDSALFEVDLSGGLASLTTGDVSALGGETRVAGQLDLNQAERPAAAGWSARGLTLRELLRGAAPEGEVPPLAGLVTSEGRATMSASAGIESLRGSGRIDVTEGRFAAVGMIERLLSALQLTRSGPPAARSELRGEFALRGPALDFSSLSLKTPVASLRGQGVLHFDGRLDFLVNGGPLERVQDALGDVGNLLAVVSDRFVKYRVRGSVGEPKITVVPLGMGAVVNREELP